MVRNLDGERTPTQRMFSASTEFSSSASYYKGEALKDMRRKLNGREFEISAMKRVEPPEGNPYWLLHVSELELAFKCNKPSGLALAEVLGDDIQSWVGNFVTIGVQRYHIDGKTTYGAMITPVEADDIEQEDDSDLPFDDDLE